MPGPPAARGACLALAVGLGLGCSGLLGPIADFETVADDGCGGASGVITSRRALTHWSLSANGRELTGGGESPAGPIAFHVLLEPGTNELILKADGAEVASRSVWVAGPPQATLALDPPLDRVPLDRRPDFDARLTATCALGGPLRLEAAWDGAAAEPRPIGADAPVALPPVPAVEGAHRLSLRALTPGGVEVHRLEQVITVGPPCADRDRDGVLDCEGDCDDTKASVNPRAQDRPNDGIDQDCDGQDGTDADRDGHLSKASGGDDCDDARADVHPDQAEWPEPNGVDDNCDGRVDEGTRAYDDDGDGVSEDQGDCDDADKAVRPGAAELADCVDQDCDGAIDEGVSLPQRDDAFEPNDSFDKAQDLHTRDRKAFSRDLEFVTRDLKDEEWVRFWSDDGDFDLWSIGAGAIRVPPGATYRLDLVEADGRVRDSATLRDRTGRVGASGRWGRNDSGYYYLRLVPVEIPRPWCPITIQLGSG